MKFVSFANDREISELQEAIPNMPSATGVGRSPTMAPQAGQAAISVDPQAAQKAQALAIKQTMDRKKDIQDQIKAKEKEIIDLRKELASIQ